MNDTLDVPATSRLRLPTVDEIVDKLSREIAFAKSGLASALNAIERAQESLLESGRSLDYVYYNPCQSNSLTIVFTARDKQDLAALLTALSRENVRRLKDDKVFDCVDTMTRVYGLKHYELFVSLHVHLAGENCRRVEVGIQPKYEIVCD